MNEDNVIFVTNTVKVLIGLKSVDHVTKSTLMFHNNKKSVKCNVSRLFIPKSIEACQ